LNGTRKEDRERLERADENSEGRLCSLLRDAGPSPATQLKSAITVISAVLGSVETLAVAAPFLLFDLVFPLAGIAPTIDNIELVSTSTALTSLIIDPVVVFLAMFLLGRGLDLRTEYVSVLVSLVVGTLAGTYGCLLLIGAYSTFVGRLSSALPFILTDMVFYGIGAFRLALVGFAGFALAHFVAHSSTAATQTRPA
jgi:hypothetical protein